MSTSAKESPEEPRSKHPAQVLPDHFAETGLAMYLNGKTLDEVALEFNVPKTAVYRISRRDNWVSKRRFAGKVTKSLSPDSVEHLWRKKNDEVKNAIRDLVSQGKRVRSAAELFGWTLADIKDWMREDEEFNRRVRQALAIYEIKKTTAVDEFQGKDWKNHQFLLATHEELKDVYKDSSDDKGKVAIVVNLERPTLGELPQITIDRPAVLENSVIADVDYTEVKQLEKPLVTRAKPEKTPEQLAQERVDAHNRAVLKRRREQRKQWWEKQKDANGA